MVGAVEEVGLFQVVLQAQLVVQPRKGVQQFCVGVVLELTGEDVVEQFVGDGLHLALLLAFDLSDADTVEQE